ncbi:hypothetical protein ACDQ55_15885 [Chitinophaga sp. 30R24]|uniref:hypothetical protein n=1 Tax=Chitinophaga sp. 30R24 TaxID=3248838 RepID=UPI003B8F3170
MKQVTITVDGKEYTIQVTSIAGNMLYIVKACDADTVFSADDQGNIVPRDIPHPPESLQKIGRGIQSALNA